MSKTSDLLAKLKARLQDSDGAIFPESYLISELNDAQYELLNFPIDEYIDELLETKRKVFPISGEFDLSLLNYSLLKSKQSVVKLFIYNHITGKKTPARLVSMGQVNKILNNSFYEGTVKSPAFTISSGKIQLYAKDSEGLTFYGSGMRDVPLSSITPNADELIDNGGPIVGGDDGFHDYYVDCTIKEIDSEHELVFNVEDYDGDTSKFYVIGSISEEINQEYRLISPSENYIGFVDILYYREPVALNYAYVEPPGETTDIECELSESLVPILLLLAESSIWRSDGKYERADSIYNRAMNMINALIGKLKPADNVGYNSVKE